MNDEQIKKSNKRILKRQAETLWQLVITTPGMADLAEPLKRAEHHFDRLTQRQRVTVAVIASQLAKRFHEIEKEERQKAEAEATATPASEEITAEIVRPDQVIPPNQDDGSGTGD